MCIRDRARGARAAYRRWFVGNWAGARHTGFADVTSAPVTGAGSLGRLGPMADDPSQARTESDLPLKPLYAAADLSGFDPACLLYTSRCV